MPKRNNQGGNLMPRKGQFKERGQRYFRAGERAALEQLEPVLRSVIEAIGLIASARTVEASLNKDLVERLGNIKSSLATPEWVDDMADEAAQAIRDVEAHNAGLRAVNARLVDMVEVLRRLAASRVDRETLAAKIIEEARKFAPPPAFIIKPGALDGVDLSKLQSGPVEVMPLTATEALERMKAWRCPVCGETVPEPHELCLVRGTHERGTPCQYSREGQARTAAALEEQEGPYV